MCSNFLPLYCSNRLLEKMPHMNSYLYTLYTSSCIIVVYTFIILHMHRHMCNPNKHCAVYILNQPPAPITDKIARGYYIILCLRSLISTNNNNNENIVNKPSQTLTLA